MSLKASLIRQTCAVFSRAVNKGFGQYQQFHAHHLNLFEAGLHAFECPGKSAQWWSRPCRV